MKEDNTIKEVVESELCTGCGTCIALCPNEAIKLTINEKKGIYVPELNEGKCNNCNTCYEVCPGHEVDFKQLNLEIFGKEPEDVLIGNYLNCYTGYATDYDIRYNSASGGLVTQLLIFALEEGIIDGALITRMKKENPLEPEPFIARTKEEIIEASKSKYCPVPANVMLKEILESGEGERFAVVGLPCHIHGIRKAELINKKLKAKIVLHFGLFCSHTVNFLGTEFWLDNLGIKGYDIKRFNYRGEGWPGGMGIELKNGDKRFIPLLDSYWSNMFVCNFFTPMRCTSCNDETSELADISIGDAWLPEVILEDKVGKSIIISRNVVSEDVLRSALSKNKIVLTEINNNLVIQSQGISKKKNFKARISVLTVFGKNNTPIYSSEFLRPNLMAYFYAILLYFDLKISSNRYLRFFLKHLPFSILKLYSMFIRIIHRISLK